jgi:hypothetical protein
MTQKAIAQMIEVSASTVCREIKEIVTNMESMVGEQPMRKQSADARSVHLTVR